MTLQINKQKVVPLKLISSEVDLKQKTYSAVFLAAINQHRFDRCTVYRTIAAGKIICKAT